MKLYLKKAIIINRAPFDRMEFDFTENEIAVLSSINGKGKTTLISHLADSFYEMAKKVFKDVSINDSAFYRVSSGLFSLDSSKPSLVYFRYQLNEQELDYIDIRGSLTKQDYDLLIKLDRKIDFAHFSSDLKRSGVVKKFSSNYTKEIVQEIFNKNILTYFPSYRFESPGYLSDPQEQKIIFSNKMRYNGTLIRPIEVVSGLKELFNWFMDLALDLQYTGENLRTFASLNQILSVLLKSKIGEEVRIGVGQRNLGATRLQIVKKATNDLIYPNLFNLSSGETALLSLFGEILRQADMVKINSNLDDVSGIVLVDEIDKHLHISLQKEALPRLIKLFPKVQFIISSHSPFLNLGLAEECSLRARVIDISSGLAICPSSDPQYLEVYNIMLNENENFKTMYDALKAKITDVTKLQIITEGKNTEHIEKAFSVLAPELLMRISVVKGAESSSGDQQLKNAFEIMSKGAHGGKFLFVWDCDSRNKLDTLVETNNFHKFCFQFNDQNQKAKKGIENLYPEDLFSIDVYTSKTVDTDYGGSRADVIFDKNLFLNKVKLLDGHEIFTKFSQLIERVRILLT